MLNLAIICGGPSRERGISLNSARCVIDHLPDNTETKIIYVAENCIFYEISRSQLYCNTPSDFDFKLAETATQIQSLENFLADTDLVFPLIYGKFGEDGQLQKILENIKVNFIGTGSQELEILFHKYRANLKMAENGFDVTKCISVKKGQENLLEEFATQHKKFVIKPARSGSSIGVRVCTDLQIAQEHLQEIFNSIDDEAIIEEYCIGREFTILLFATENGPVALVPTEIETSYQDNQILDYRKKYLPTHNTFYHTPPKSFSLETIKQIRQKAEKIFNIFEMKDFARIDGWVTEEGKIIFTDFNPVSGAEQNSFLFKQASFVGLSHGEALQVILKSACQRYNLKYSQNEAVENQGKEVFVIFGGSTPERQVSLMSGTNVWLKLAKSKLYNPSPFLLDKNGDVWLLPYSLCLNHTVEEIYDNCVNYQEISDLKKQILQLINNQYMFKHSGKSQELYKFSMEEFVSYAKNKNAFVFIALHGGFGENGEFQKLLNRNNLMFNGSGPEASTICMDKFLTGQYLNDASFEKLFSLPRKSINLKDFLHDKNRIWLQLEELFGKKSLIIKPRYEGCSSGIVIIKNKADFERYFSLIQCGGEVIPKGKFYNQPEEVELPNDINKDFIIEEYIEVDHLEVKKNGVLSHIKKHGWIELTAGVIESGGNYHGLNPSITIAENAVLSIEEKFQGGTGVNITPPPSNIFSLKQIALIRSNIEKFAKLIGVTNYARIDLFFNIQNDEMIIIEANSLPALTPSTVIYHQMLAENPPLYPLPFLELIITSAMASNLIRTA